MKISALILAASPAFILSHDFTVDYFGVPFNVLIACALGAYSGFSFGDRVQPRSRMFQLFVACLIMGAAWTAVIAGAIGHFTDWHMSKGAQAGLGAVISCMSRFFIPELIKRIGPLLDKIPFFSAHKGDKQ